MHPDDAPAVEQDASPADPARDDLAALQELFTYHPPTGDQPERYRAIRRAGLELASVIWDCTPAGPDRTAAIRKVRESVMTANAAIATQNAAAALR